MNPTDAYDRLADSTLPQMVNKYAPAGRIVSCCGVGRA